MKRDIIRQHRLWTGPVGLLVFAVVFQFVSIDAAGQSALERITGLSAERATRITNSLKAGFNYTPRYPATGQSVRFTDASSGGPASWLWDFGDGTTSTAQHPQHIYTAPGFRKVTLTVTSASGSKRSTKNLTVMPQSTGATFVYSPSTPGPGQTVQFADTTTGSPTSWLWDFGDGTRSTAKNPSHAFREPQPSS